jgi:hypothetical protein
MATTTLYPVHHAALTRLLALAHHHTVAGSLAADFLLAWWHSAIFGTFDLSSLEPLDLATQRDMALVYELATLAHGTPAELGIVGELEAVAFLWVTGRAA